MKLKRTGLVRVGAWILTGLLAADIGLQLGGVEIGSKWEWREMGRRFSERLLKGAVNQANLAAFYYDGKQKKYRVAEYMPSPEDLEAVAEENTAVLLEDMAGENSEAVRNVIPSSDLKKGAVSKALIVRTKKEIRRVDGSYIRFDDNACVLLNNAGELRGSRIFGPVARELRAVNMKVVSLAPEVL